MTGAGRESTRKLSSGGIHSSSSVKIPLEISGPNSSYGSSVSGAGGWGYLRSNSNEEVSGAGVSEAGGAGLGSGVEVEDETEDGAGNAGSGEMVQQLLLFFVGPGDGRKTICGGYPKSTLM